MWPPVVEGLPQPEVFGQYRGVWRPTCGCSICPFPECGVGLGKSPLDEGGATATPHRPARLNRSVASWFPNGNATWRVVARRAAALAHGLWQTTGVGRGRDVHPLLGDPSPISGNVACCAGGARGGRAPCDVRMRPQAQTLPTGFTKRPPGTSGSDVGMNRYKRWRTRRTRPIGSPLHRVVGCGRPSNQLSCRRFCEDKGNLPSCHVIGIRCGTPC